MTNPARWGKCIANYGEEVTSFTNCYFGQEHRSCLYIGGAGFDPRCLLFAQLLSERLSGRLDAVLLREKRPEPPQELVSRADQNVKALQKLIPGVRVIDIDVLAEGDSAVIGGRRATTAIAGISLDSYTDIVLDFSAVSIGISFPVAKLLLEAANATRKNLHAVVVSNGGVDDSIKSVPNDAVDPVHGFSAHLDLAESEADPKIWMPALAHGNRAALQTVRDKIRGPVSVCPILPLSQRDPRAADKLIMEFEAELYQSWEVEASNVIYAIEDDPLDLYRTIDSIFRRYRRVFVNVSGSHLVLTPSGSKTFAIGALMAAIEHELPVRYVEAVAYEVAWSAIDEAQSRNNSKPIHVWLAGDPYR